MRNHIVIAKLKCMQKTARANCLLLAAGRVPTVKGLGLEDIGVKYDEDGIKVMSADQMCILQT